MPIFSLPLGPSSERNRSRVHLQPPTSRKRKRASDHDSHTFDEDKDDDTSKLKPPPRNSSPDDFAFNAASTNPLSLTPAEIQQYRLAGLSLDATLPSVKDWPHRALSRHYDHNTRDCNHDHNTDGRIVGHERLEEADGKEATRKTIGPMLRMHHLSVLTTLLHKCLMDGDIPRATRAWALLLRMQVGGLGIDVRGQGYWGIGAEVLVRAGERGSRETKWRTESESENEIFDKDEDINGNEILREFMDSSRRVGVEEKKANHTRWGTKEGLAHAREYYQRLILQYPYRRQFSEYINALDFWPAMLGCEIYDIQHTHQVSLAHIDCLEDDPDFHEQNWDSDDNRDINDLATDQFRDARRERARRDRLWRLRDDVRLTTLHDAEVIAKRMTEQMATPPYSDSAALLRLQGMLALYISDLSVPEIIGEDENEHDVVMDGLGASARRTVVRQRRAARSWGLEKQKSERIRAKETLRKASRAGSRLGPGVRRFSVEDEDDKGTRNS